MNTAKKEHNSPIKKYFDSDYILQTPTWSLEHLRLAGVQQRLPRPRTLAWAILLDAIPAPQCDITNSIKAHRMFYTELKSRLTMDPRSVVDDDPLSQNDKSAWNQYFCDVELKAMIHQDVVRTYPDEAYFRDKEIQAMMVRVLFCWARSNEVGYRQGMHEILAPLLYELNKDREYAPNQISDSLKYYLHGDYIEHDSFMLFTVVMKGLEKFYTTGDAVPTPCGRIPTSNSVPKSTEIIKYLDRVKEEYLVPIDRELSEHLREIDISLEFFGIRWLRLLFGREFQRAEIPQLWGFLFADGPAFPHIHFVIVAVLVAMRGTLLDPEPGVVLAALMRPPALAVGHVCALALHLRSPREHPRPAPPPLPRPAPPPCDPDSDGSEGVEEGADVARALSCLRVLRSQLPPAAEALRQALRPPLAPDVEAPLQRLLQLAALLHCRQHAFVHVDAALEAAEGPCLAAQAFPRKQLLPVAMLGGRRAPARAPQAPAPGLREVPLKVLRESEGLAADLPLDPVRLRPGL